MAPSERAATSSLALIDTRDPDNATLLGRYGTKVELAVPVGDQVYLLSENELQIVRVAGVPAPPPTPTPADARCPPQLGSASVGASGTFRSSRVNCPSLAFLSPPSNPNGSRYSHSSRCNGLSASAWNSIPKTRPPIMSCLGTWVRTSAPCRDRTGNPGSPRAACCFFPETRQNVYGDLRAAWESHGLAFDGQPGASPAESMVLFGLPTSPLITATLEGQVYQVQWFERACMEVHSENPPPFHVLFGLLGRERLFPTPRAQLGTAFSSPCLTLVPHISAVSAPGSGRASRR